MTRPPRTRCTAARSPDTRPACLRDSLRARAPRRAVRLSLSNARRKRSCEFARKTSPPAVTTGPLRGRTVPVFFDAFVREPGRDAVGDAPLDRALVQVVRHELRPRRAGHRIAVARVPAGRERSAVARRRSLIPVRILRQPDLRRIAGLLVAGRQRHQIRLERLERVVRDARSREIRGIELTPLRTIDRNPSEPITFSDAHRHLPGAMARRRSAACRRSALPARAAPSGAAPCPRPPPPPSPRLGSTSDIFR